MSADPTTAYAEAVVAGEIVAGQPVRWACQRHLDDLERGGERGLVWDPGTAECAFDFFRILRHTEGEWGLGEGEPFELADWQKFVTGQMFGWLREDGTRRFRVVWVEVARKNGKSTWCAGCGHYLLVLDSDARGQIWTAATKRDQARIIHRAAVALRDKSPDLRKTVRKVRDRLICRGSFFAPLGADADTEDGLNPSVVLLDEVHAHRDSKMWDVLRNAMGSRREPLFIAVTTAGFSKHGFGKQQHDYYRSIVDPRSGVDDDSALVYIAELDEGDDPFDERNWIKANPNLGVSLKLDFMRARALEARQNPRIENDFRCKNLNEWVSQIERWLPMEDWDQCVGPWAVWA